VGSYYLKPVTSGTAGVRRVTTQTMGSEKPGKKLVKYSRTKRWTVYRTTEKKDINNTAWLGSTGQK